MSSDRKIVYVCQSNKRHFNNKVTINLMPKCVKISQEFHLQQKSIQRQLVIDFPAKERIQLIERMVVCSTT